MLQANQAVYQMAHAAGNYLQSVQPLSLTAMATPVKTPQAAAAFIRRQWDESIHYQYKLAVLQLNAELVPVGVQFFYISHNELLPYRMQFRNIAASDTHYVYIAINSPTFDYASDLGTSQRHAQLMEQLAHALHHAEISPMGFFIMDCKNEVFLDSEEKLLAFDGE
jgi:hypothetical protein